VELAEPEWTYRGLANLRNFSAEPSVPDPVSLGSGVSIRKRSFPAIRPLGFNEATIHALRADAEESVFGFSQYVICVEHRAEKSPDNIITGDSTGHIALLRTLTCMRLASSGDVTTGPMWAIRPTRFETGRSSGVGRSGWPTVDQGGGTFRLTPSLVRSIRRLQPIMAQLYEQFSHLPKSSYKGPGNLDLALRSFDSTYDRFPRNADGSCWTA
jgi:hypothetical protein